MKIPKQTELAELCLGLLEILQAAQAANQNQEVAPVRAGRPAAIFRAELTTSNPLARPRHEGDQ